MPNRLLQHQVICLFYNFVKQNNNAKHWQLISGVHSLHKLDRRPPLGPIFANRYVLAFHYSPGKDISKFSLLNSYSTSNLVLPCKCYFIEMEKLFFSFLMPSSFYTQNIQVYVVIVHCTIGGADAGSSFKYTCIFFEIICGN